MVYWILKTQVSVLTILFKELSSRRKGTKIGEGAWGLNWLEKLTQNGR